MRGHIKHIIVAGVVRGLIPMSLADLLIGRFLREV